MLLPQTEQTEEIIKTPSSSTLIYIIPNKSKSTPSDINYPACMILKTIRPSTKCSVTDRLKNVDEDKYSTKPQPPFFSPLYHT